MKKTELCGEIWIFSLKNSIFKGKSFLFSLFAIFLLTPLVSYSQITINEKNVPLESILAQIEDRTDYVFLYNTVTIDDKQNLSVNINSPTAEITPILDKVFANTEIAYNISGKQIILSAQEKPAIVAQAKMISGLVKDSNGDPLIGVSINVDKKQAGTITDVDGKYTLSVTKGDVLVITYTGFVAQNIVVGERNVYDIVMLEDMIQLEAVVVTAMGIRREIKSLTYNVQQINAEEISTVKDANFMGSLAGKVAGVTINQSSTGMGGSARVVMRGAKSLSSNNNALYVLDGIPMASMKSKQPDNFYESEGQGDNEGIAMLNADDIESMSVLTGAAAAALYGNEGSSGVVLITSKKGQAGRTRVSYSNNTTFSSPFVMPKFQNTYGRSGETYSSWGPKLDTPSSYKPKDFFQTGTNTMNTVAVSTGSEAHLLRASFGATNSRGIIPNSKYERYNMTVRSVNELIKNKLSMDIGVSYVKQKDRNPTSQGLYYNPIVAAYLFPPGDDFNRFVPYQVWDPERNFMVQNWSYEGEWLEGTKQNPLWTAHKNVFENNRDKLLLNASLTYTITDWINVSVRARMDKAMSFFERKLYASSHTLFAHSPKGNYSDYSQTNQNLYADFLVNIDKQLNSSFRLTANVGGSFKDDQSKYWGYNGPLISVVDFFHLNNVDIEEKKSEQIHTRNNAWYGTAQLGYKSMLYLDLTGRADYFSTLYGPKNTSPIVAYPSVGGTVVMSEILGLPQQIVPLWKIRSSYSQVGNPPPPYLTKVAYEVFNGVISPSPFYPVNLKAEKTKAFEIGTDVSLFNNLFNVAFTYYNTNTYNQLFKYNLPPTTGYSFTYANAGKVNNHGIELTVGVNQNLGPVHWESTIAYSVNRNEIKELLGDEIKDPLSGEYMKAPTEFEVANANNSYRMLLTKGGTMGDIYVSTLRRDKNGDIYVDPGTGKFEVNRNEYVKIGEAAPKYTLSMRNKFSWKDLSLGFMLDARVGGVVVSSTQALLDQFGVSKASADARDRGGITMNLGQLTPEAYYTTIGEGRTGAALSEYTYSATNVRMRELSLGYNIPPKLVNNACKISVSLIARNLWMLYNKAPYDPEVTSNTGTYYQGYDYFMPPSQRNIGFGVNVTF